MWDLALGTATYVCNITPHKNLNYKSPIKTFAPEAHVDVNQIKRFGCVAYISQTAKTKFNTLALKTIFVGYE